MNENEQLLRRVNEKVIADFASVFIVDLRDDTYRFLFRNSESGFADVPGGVYSDTIIEYTSRVNENYRDMWRELCNIDTVRSMLTDREKIEYVYPLEGIAKRWRRCQLRVLDRENGVPVTFVMTYFVIDDDRAAKLELEGRLASEQRKLKELFNFSSLFLDTYEFAGYVNLESRRVQVYKSNPDFTETYSSTESADNYLDILADYSRRKVNPDDRDALLECVRPENLRELIRDREFTHLFRYTENGQERRMRMQVIRGEDDNHAAFGFADITEEFEEEQRLIENNIRQSELLSNTTLRADALAFVADHNPDVEAFMEFFGNRVLRATGCDQVIFLGVDGHRSVINAPGIRDVPQCICSQCPFVDVRSSVYAENGSVLMNDCRCGHGGVMVHPDCPAKSSFMQSIHTNGRLAGLFTIHYLNSYHEFSPIELETMRTVAAYLGLLLGRIETKKLELEKLQAESSNLAKTRFLFNMSHDIRTPMNAILGYTDLALRHRQDEERVDDCLKKIKTSGAHLLNLINDILEMSRIEAGKLELTEAPMDIREAVLGVKHMCQALSSSKSISFNVNVGQLRSPYIYADELHVNEVLLNIISNAIKYTNEDGAVSYSVLQLPDLPDGRALFRFVISDNGIGMSEEFQAHLFETFSRERTSTVSKREGTGLGLSIVKSIVDLHGGTIAVESAPGKGSTFTVELPFSVMDDAAIAEYLLTHTESVDIGDDLTLEGRRILLVEDNEMNREIAEELLTEAGLIVETADDGTVAVEMAAKNAPGYYDFILMDIQMPVMNGYAATLEIRRIYAGADVPIIALSANAFEEDRQKSIAAGMNDHVAKPIDAAKLLETLRTLAK